MKKSRLAVLGLLGATACGAGDMGSANEAELGTSQGEQVVNTQWGQQGDVPLVGDVNKDGVAERIIYRPSAAAFYVLQVDVATNTTKWLSTVYLGSPAYKPLVGDVDGDGAADLVVYGTQSGYWEAKDYTGKQVMGNALFGQPGDTPFLANVDSDPAAELVVYAGNSYDGYAWYAADAPSLPSSTAPTPAPTGRGSASIPAPKFPGKTGTAPIFPPVVVAGPYASKIAGPVFLGEPGSRVMLGNVDSDPQAEIVEWDTNTGVWRAKNFDGSWAMTGVQWGMNGDLPGSETSMETSVRTC